ncbi:ribonuclease H [Thiomicrorhabdus immobilis]|uniref:ribonuclease H n=1 Tax=Thiomicrorhabdus immobilis TaxID=2791037 RepID=A0ABN6CZV7_9GAMM|nr:ribonuclease H [Thiomicrorhabdus immobilis]BCN93214.1 ribonuclease H [Thiomicrorhabdus immobilis]
MSLNQTHPAASQKFAIYTDGGYFEKQDIGGWGLVIFQNDEEIYRNSGWQRHTSSLEMELTAARKALEYIQSQNKAASKSPVSCKTLYTDSRIIIEGLTQKYTLWCENQWRVKSGKTVVYKELWQSLSNLTQHLDVEWKWVKGHNGNQGNTIADQLARDAVIHRIHSY